MNRNNISDNESQMTVGNDERQFYTLFPEKIPTLWGKLSWSHFKRLLSVRRQFFLCKRLISEK